MASEVFLHIGLPKTGTTYLQQVLWGSTRQLTADGILLPGSGHREHLWAALDLQQRPGLERRHPRAPGTLDRLLDQAAGHPGALLLTHEFFCGAGRLQARGLVERLAPATVHILVTARDTLGMLTAGWAEYVKNGGTRPLSEMPQSSGGRHREFGWRTWDLGGVLRRWGDWVPPERVHVLPLPGRDAPSDQHWRNVASVLGVDPERYVVPERAANPALGVVQVELLRRINRDLGDFRRPVDRGTWIRGYLAERHLVRQDGARLTAAADQVEECRVRADRAVDLIRQRGFHVIGDLESLRVASPQPHQQHPAAVSDAELLASASTLVADMLADVRRLDPPPDIAGAVHRPS